MCRTVLRLAIAVILTTLGAAAVLAGMPPNPERPMNAANCAQALQRVKEAALGSPLVGKEANRKHLLAAVTQAEQLCLHENAKKLRQQPSRR